MALRLISRTGNRGIVSLQHFGAAPQTHRARDITLRGQTIRASDKVVLAFVSATVTRTNFPSRIPSISAGCRSGT
jgi:hypothetical protein